MPQAQKPFAKRGAKIVVEMVLSNHTALGTCFSEGCDLRSQWRGYAQDGAGFSVSFDKEKLEDLSRGFEDGSSLQLSKIAYGHQNLDDVNAVIRLLHQAFGEDATKYQEGTDGIGEIALDFTPEKHQQQREAACALFTVKNRAFREEKEWRLFLFNSPSNIANVEFRENRNLLSPFVRLPIPADAIVGVTLGPTNPTPEPMVEAALEAHGINCHVSRSNASYRPR
ncbi:MAG: DUF2971 domain-containing protein [Marinosulfonomonas sp.]|nr:DUF2971 domain-containing protein [Marinosulfonomonas sp.]